MVLQSADMRPKIGGSTRLRRLQGQARHCIGLLSLFAAFFCLQVAPPAQAQVAFACTGDIYQVQSGQLRIFDPITSQYTDVGPVNPSYNSLAFNTQDNLLYATRTNGVVRIDAAGTMTNLFDIGFNSYVGDMDDSNHLYLRRDSSTMTVVNIITQGQYDVTLSTDLSIGAADWAFVDTPAGPRLIAPGRSELSLINPATGQNTKSSIANYPVEGSSGATWADANGRVFTFRNTTGNVYEILDYLTATPHAVLVAVGDPSSNNDGSSCRNQPFPNLPPIAFDDQFTTRFQTALTSENLIIDNGNGTDHDPDGTPVTALSGLISEPSNGAVSINPDGTFTYTPSTGFSGVDQFTYEIEDASGLRAHAVATITVTRPQLRVEKVSQLFEPAPNAAFHIPGNDVVYTISIANDGNQEVDDGTLLIVDNWPAQLEFLNADIGLVGAADHDPVVWQDSASGLDFNYARDVAYSNAATPPANWNACSYTPASGYDPNVRFVCIQPKGQLMPAGSATIQMRGRIQ